MGHAGAWIRVEPRSSARVSYGAAKAINVKRLTMTGSLLRTITGVLATALGIAMSGSAGAYESSERGASPADVVSIPSGVRPADRFGTSSDHKFGSAFSEGHNACMDATHSGDLLSTADQATGDFMLNGMCESDDGTSRLSPYVGAGFGTVDANSWLPDNSATDHVTAAQFRGGAALRPTPNLRGSLQYRWTYGSTPRLSLAGIVARLKVDHQGLVFGLNYRF